jgi:glutaredoxin
MLLEADKSATDWSNHYGVDIVSDQESSDTALKSQASEEKTYDFVQDIQFSTEDTPTAAPPPEVPKILEEAPGESPCESDNDHNPAYETQLASMMMMDKVILEKEEDEEEEEEEKERTIASAGGKEQSPKLVKNNESTSLPVDTAHDENSADRDEPTSEAITSLQQNDSSPATGDMSHSSTSDATKKNKNRKKRKGGSK